MNGHGQPIDFSACMKVERQLAALEHLDTSPLMARWADILMEDVRRRALAGLDVNEQPLQITVRQMRPDLSGRFGSGPPLAPHYDQSRLIRLARAETGQSTSSQGVYAQVTWPGFVDDRGHDILAYHRAGIPSRRGTIVRDVVGHASPTAAAKIFEVTRDWILSTFRALRGYS